jgi:hypothetical protein
MVFPVPVLELHIVDMISVEVVQDGLDLALGHAAVGREETVTGEAARLGRHINTDSGYHRVAPGYGHIERSHIATEIVCRRLPCPGLGGHGLLLDQLSEIGITHGYRLLG